MHGRIYSLKAENIEKQDIYDEDELFSYLIVRGVDYVKKVSMADFGVEVHIWIDDFLNNVLEGGGVEWTVCDEKYFVSIPMIVLEAYVENRIDEYKQRVQKISYQNEVNKARFGASAVEGEAGFEALGDFYDDLMIDGYGVPRSFFAWALEQIAKYGEKATVKYEVVQIFSFHY